MVGKNKILGSLAGFGLLLSVASGAVANPSDHASPSTHHQATAQMGQFRRIEQPVGFRVGVAIGGLTLIGLELWWFLWSKKLPLKS